MRVSLWLRAEGVAAAWECFSALLFVSAVFPAAFASPWPGVLFAVTLAASALVARSMVRSRSGRFGFAAALRLPSWVGAITPLLPGSDLRVLVACCGFGVMAFALRRFIYRRWLEPTAGDLVHVARELRVQLSENAAVAGIVGGHVMLLFSVAFLRTRSNVVFRAWWEIVPALTLIGTAGFTLTVRLLTADIVSALEASLAAQPSDEAESAAAEAPEATVAPEATDATERDDATDPALAVRLAAALVQAQRAPARLSALNFGLWLVCIAIGVAVIHPPPRRVPDIVVALSCGTLFAWGVSFYQRGWHTDALAPVLRHLRAALGVRATVAAVSLRRRMLTEFGVPVLFTFALSLFASIGLYRALSDEPTWQDDFAAITALSASFAMLVIAVGNLFRRVARELSAPLTEIAASADRVATGELALAVAEVSGPREVVGLGRSIERMRQSLATTIAALESERETLETRVAERTIELRRALDELKQAQAALVHGERMALLGQLVAGVAHEIYNPLTAVTGSISSLERVRDELGAMLAASRRAEANLPPRDREALEELRASLDVDGALEDLRGIVKVVNGAARRSVEIVATLKMLARSASEPEPVDLTAGLEETLALSSFRTRAVGIEVDTRLEPLGLVECHAGEIHQVFMNLVSNAIDAVTEGMPERGGGRILVRATTAGDDVLIVLADNGPGVTAGLEERIFEPFFTTKAAGKGTGLGLSISREITNRHGGSLTVERAAPPLGGAQFVCRLPRARPPRSARSGS